MLNINLLSRTGPGIVTKTGIVHGISSEFVEADGGVETNRYFVLDAEPKDMGVARLWLVRKTAVGITPDNQVIVGSVVKMNNNWELFIPRTLSS
ncbi:hypothetical protein COU93_01695 [Candidatus Shapirobacteria bacterium CG10_big_fil_rev_8_21_14_0_10_36_6]|uniref:Uncharacterized protein n=1 Tax=Candidatus Shapirobacteria bacterium CG10_big_fil_rev_8_21_14_0_10_36_6 TaxID=1974886 RepID=A0A2M8L1U6_9BACT|nr:MAG: hypothetical protein COU93_01695 [Candidatus Shapirobacteria bacterium CG10_big_fil_rev_8_21_14_0_10_36_6]